MRINGITVTNHEVGRALESVENQGGIISKCGNGHFKVIPPDKNKQIVFLPSTPSDRRSINNVIGKLRRSGFNL